MAKFFGNLNLVFVTGLILAIVVMMAYASSATVDVNSVFRWLHVFFGILWIGLLYYLNFVQVPTMPKVPAELKKGVTGYIAPNVFFFFRWAALLTVITGLVVAFVGHGGEPGYGHRALAFNGLDGRENLIGLGMWLALIMAFNVWFIIWPNQKKALGIVTVEAAEKAAAARMAMLTSRFNTMLSIPMLYCMVAQQNAGL